MVNQLSNYNSAYVSDAMKYLQHMAVVEHKKDLGDDIKSSLMMSPLMAVPTAFGTSGTYNSAQAVLNGITPAKTSLWSKIKNIPSTAVGGIKSAFEGIKSGKTTTSSISNVLKNSSGYELLNELDTKIASAKSANASTKALVEQRNALKSALDNAMASGTKVSDDVLKSADDVIAAASKTAKKGFFAKIGTVISKPFKAAKNAITSSKTFESAYGAIKSTQTGSKILSKLGGFAKLAKKGGAVFDLAIEGTMQLFTEVIPAFKNGGFDSGVKQIGKSGLQVAGSVGGWVAGAKAGAALGAAVGSIFPGAGTAIGGAIGGIVGGLLGSSVLTGVAKKITGKSENEIIKEEQLEAQAQAVASDAQSMRQLQNAVAQEIQLDMQDGELSEDGQKMLQYLNQNTSASDTSFGSLTNNWIATNAYGAYDFSVPQDALPQMNYDLFNQTV